MDLGSKGKRLWFIAYGQGALHCSVGLLHWDDHDNITIGKFAVPWGKVNDEICASSAETEMMKIFYLAP